LRLVSISTGDNIDHNGELWRTSKQRPGAYSGQKQYFNDVPSLAIACLQARLTPDAIPAIESLLQVEANPRLRLGLVSTLGRGESIEFSEVLERIVAKPEYCLNEKVAAIRSTLPSQSPHTTTFLENTLWNQSEALRDIACFMLQCRASPVSPQAIERIQQLIKDTSDVNTRERYVTALQKLTKRSKSRVQ
jgi:hypothetical protein